MNQQTIKIISCNPCMEIWLEVLNLTGLCCSNLDFNTKKLCYELQVYKINVKIWIDKAFNIKKEGLTIKYQQTISS